jgi:hypothetical protein
LRSRALGANGGFEDNTIANMAAHTHPGSYPNNAVGSVASTPVITITNGTTTSASVPSQGGGAADGNLTPFLTFTCYVWT